MAENVWRRRAPLWLRIVAGILLLPPLGIAVIFAADALGSATPLVWLFAIAPALAWLIVYRAPTPIAAALLVLPLLGSALVIYYVNQMQRAFEDVGSYLDKAPDPHTAEPHTPAQQPEAPLPNTPAPAAEAPALAEEMNSAEEPSGDGYHYETPTKWATENEGQAAAPAPGPDLGIASGGGGGSAAKPTMAEFPWPPPAASASYVLPDKLFESYRRVGDVAAAILVALEHNGYVERSFFRTEPGGAAMVTRLERIKDDGSPSAEQERWPAAAQRLESTRSLLDFLHGLFFVDPGHYRVIVFVLQDLPFSQSAEGVTAQQAHAWLATGANVLSSEIAALPFAGGHVTVLIYEFASDGTKVQVVESRLTGKQHLEKAGLLAALDNVQ